LIRYVLAFDIGTTSIKAGVVDLRDFRVVSKRSTPAEIYYPRVGWAEKDPDRLWEQITSLSRELFIDGTVKPEDISGIIYTAHMAGVLPIDRDGDVLRNMIIWLDERAAGLPKDLWSGVFRVEGYNIFKLIKFLRITGGAPSKTGKDPLSKILWIRENEPDIFRSVYKFLDVKGYLIYRSTGSIVTSPDEANLTWLADTRDGSAKWHPKLLNMYGLDSGMFPEIKDSIEIAGRLRDDAAEELGLSPGLPVIVGCGDLTSAAIGSGAVGEAEPHIYIGTSDWIAAHISSRKTDVRHYIGSLLSGIPGRYLLISEQEVAAGALEWFMRLTGFSPDDYDGVEEAVKSSPAGSRDLVFFPWFYGERSPIDDPYVRGVIFNLTFTHDKGDIFRAIMEGVAYNIRWAFQYFIKLAGPGDTVNIVGGGALFDTWCQIVSDVLGIRIRRIRDPGDAGLRGSATIASISLGIYDSFEDAVKKYGVDRVFQPNSVNREVYNRLFNIYSRFYGRNKGLFRDLNPIHP
jgi:xylulokinase